MFGLLALSSIVHGGSLIETLGAGSSFAGKAWTEGLFAYHLVNVSVTMQYNSTSTNDGRTALLSGAADYCLTEGPFTTPEKLAYPDLIVLPVIATAVVPIFHIPGFGAHTIELTLDQIARIFLGDIRYWNDTNLTARNPLLAQYSAPIDVIVRRDSSGSSLFFTTALAHANPAFANTIGQSEEPQWRPSNDTCTSLNMSTCLATPNCTWDIPDQGTTLSCFTEFPRIIPEEQNLGVAGKVAATPFSIGYAVLSDAEAQGVDLIGIVGPGRVVYPNADSITHAVLEKGSRPLAPDNLLDITAAEDPAAWPICGFSYVGVRANYTRATCAVRQAVVNFWLWFVRSTTMRELADDNGFVVIPPIVRQVSDLEAILKTVRCADGSFAITETETDDYMGAGLSLGTISTMFKLYLRIFTAEQHFSWSYEADDSVTSLNNVLSFNLNFATAIPALLPSNLRSKLAQQNVRLMPAFLTAATPAYALPRDTINSGSYLVVDWNVLGLVFTGVITTWNDSRLQSLNPNIRFPNSTINVVVGAGEAAGVFVDAMYRNSGPFRAAVTQAMSALNISEIAYPFNWTWLFSWNGFQAPSSFIIAAEQNRGSQLLLNRDDGYISYRVIIAGPDAPDDAATLLHDGALMRFNVSSMRSCTGSSGPLEGVWMPRGPGCWPLTQLVTIALFESFSSSNNKRPPTYEGGELVCDSEVTLELMQWLLETDELEVGAIDIGLGWLSRATRMSLLDEIVRFTCDGQTILRSFPQVWEMPSALFVIIILFGAIGIVICMACAVTMYRYRLKLTFKKAGPYFMMIVLFGLALLYLSALLFALPASDSTCGAMYWCANVGFTCVFGPLFFKNLRIYRVFLSKQFKVSTLTNTRIFLYFLLLLSFHIILLGVHQGMDAYRMSVQTRIYPKYTLEIALCTSSSWLFLADIAYCCLLLLSNAALAWGVRHVDRTFNESKKIGLVVYNTIVAMFVGLILISTIDVRGTGVIGLYALLTFWVCSFIVVTHFLVKVRKVLKHKGDQGSDTDYLWANLVLRNSKLAAQTTNKPTDQAAHSENVVETTMVDSLSLGEQSGDQTSRPRVNTDPVESASAAEMQKPAKQPSRILDVSATTPL